MRVHQRLVKAKESIKKFKNRQHFYDFFNSKIKNETENIFTVSVHRIEIYCSFFLINFFNSFFSSKLQKVHSGSDAANFNLRVGFPCPSRHYNFFLGRFTVFGRKTSLADSCSVIYFTLSSFPNRNFASRYPFDTDKPWVFATVYFYQIFGIQISAFYNVSTDTFGSAIISHANAQVRRLGHQWSMVSRDETCLIVFT